MFRKIVTVSLSFFRDSPKSYDFRGREVPGAMENSRRQTGAKKSGFGQEWQGESGLVDRRQGRSNFRRVKGKRFLAHDLSALSTRRLFHW